MRQHPRFTTHQQVELAVEGRNALRPVWMRDISKGGLFIETAEPPPIRTTVSVIIQTPEGALELRAEVVHVRPPRHAERGGVGVQFVDLDPDKRSAIEDYVEGLAARLSSDARSSVTRLNEASLARAVQCFLRAFEEEDIYGALDAAPDAPRRQIEDRLRALNQVFETDARTLSPALATRLSHAVTLLSRVRALMLDEDRRLDYDLRHGHTHAERRLRAAPPEERIALRKRWSQLFPDRMRKAGDLARIALTHVQELDYERAIPPASAALEHDPFNTELRDALKAWKRVLSVRGGPRPVVMKTHPA